MANLVDDVWRIQLEWELNRETGSVVVHRQISAVSDSDENVLGEALVDAFVLLGNAVTGAMLGKGVKLVCATAQRIDAISPTRVFSDFSLATPSTGGIALPAAASVLMSVYPAASALIRRGRSYFPFFDSAKEEEGQIISTEVSAIGAVLNPIVLELLELPAVADLKAVLYRKVGSIADVILSSVLRPVLANQRRRVVAHQDFTIPP